MGTILHSRDLFFLLSCIRLYSCTHSAVHCHVIGDAILRLFGFRQLYLDETIAVRLDFLSKIGHRLREENLICYGA
jgi:hypothetical protein